MGLCGKCALLSEKELIQKIKIERKEIENGTESVLGMRHLWVIEVYEKGKLEPQESYFVRDEGRQYIKDWQNMNEHAKLTKYIPEPQNMAELQDLFFDYFMRFKRKERK